MSARNETCLSTDLLDSYKLGYVRGLSSASALLQKIYNSLSPYSIQWCAVFDAHCDLEKYISLVHKCPPSKLYLLLLGSDDLCV